MALTIKQIAEKCGVSVPTVSQVLNSTGKISEPTRARVLAVCDELGYRPRASAKTMRTGKFGSFTFLLGSEKYSSSFTMALFEGINHAVKAKGLSLGVARLTSQELTDERLVPKVLREWLSDGLLVNFYASISKRTEEIIERYRIPSIWINSKHAANCVYPDDFSGGFLVTRHLIGLGHTRIVYVDYSNDFSSPSGHYSAVDRFTGYQKAMQEAQLEPVLIGGGAPSTPREARIADATAWLAQRKPTAVITYGGSATYPIIIAAMAHLHLRIPRDLSIVTFDTVLDTNTGLRITTAAYDAFAMGTTAVDMLSRKIESPAEDLAPVPVPYTLIEGETTAPPTDNASPRRK